MTAVLGTQLLSAGYILHTKTECYPGVEDKTSFSYNGKKTPRNKPMFMKPGTAFIYMTYGMYYCFNISSQGEGAVVLVRAAEPIDEIHTIIKNRQDFRNKKNRIANKQLKIHELSNGPSQFCIGFNITTDSVNEKDLCSWSDVWIEYNGSNMNDVCDSDIVTSKRIGIYSYGEPWTSMPLRFYIYKSSFVSKRDKLSEKAYNQSN